MLEAPSLSGTHSTSVGNDLALLCTVKGGLMPAMAVFNPHGRPWLHNVLRDLPGFRHAYSLQFRVLRDYAARLDTQLVISTICTISCNSATQSVGLADSCTLLVSHARQKIVNVLSLPFSPT